MWKSDNVWKYFRQVSILVIRSNQKKNFFFEKNILKVLWELFLLVQPTHSTFDFSKWSWESEILFFSFIFIFQFSLYVEFCFPVYLNNSIYSELVCNNKIREKVELVQSATSSEREKFESNGVGKSERVCEKFSKLDANSTSNSICCPLISSSHFMKY